MLARTRHSSNLAGLENDFAFVLILYVLSCLFSAFAAAHRHRLAWPAPRARLHIVARLSRISIQISTSYGVSGQFAHPPMRIFTLRVRVAL